MQRLYIYIIIAAIVFVLSNNDTIKRFFSSPERTGETEPAVNHTPSDQENAYEQLKIDLYRAATTLSDLQGKVQLLKIAKENREWFGEEDYARLDTLLKTTEKELAEAENSYEEVKKEFTRATVQKMLHEQPARHQSPLKNNGTK